MQRTRKTMYYAVFALHATTCKTPTDGKAHVLYT